MGTILLVTSVRTHPVTADTCPEKVSIYKWLRLVHRKGSEGKMGVGSTRSMPGLLTGVCVCVYVCVSQTPFLKARSTLSPDTNMPHRYSKRGI